MVRNENIGRIQFETNENFNHIKTADNGLTIIKSLEINFDETSGYAQKQLQFYPNPAKNDLYFDGFEQITRLRIVSSAGAVVFDNQITNPQLDVAYLDAGLYFIYIYTHEGFEVKKFIKQ